jgi:hypothetical protein
LIALGELHFGENFHFNFGGAVLHEKRALQRGFV